MSVSEGYRWSANEPRLVWDVVDSGRRLGALVVDRAIAGRSCGGVRIAPAVETDELADLAATMTLKFAFLGIACGGAKAGLAVPAGASVEERRRRARAFGAALESLLRDGTYVPGTDMGSGERDLWELLDGARLAAGPRPALESLDVGATAAHSGWSAAVAALVGLRSLGREARDATLAVAGYGRVGAALAHRFVAGGGRLVAVSTAAGGIFDPAGLDLDRLEALRSARGDDAPLLYPGARPLPGDVVLAAPVDVLAPCAGRHMIDARVARTVRCRVLAPGGNAAVSADAEPILADARTLLLPDFVASAGGVLVSHFWPLDPPGAAAVRLIDGPFRALVVRLLAAVRPGESVPDAARRLARANLDRLQRAGAAGLRHERILSRLGRREVRRFLPPRLRTELVAWLARALRPAVAVAG